MQIGNIVFLKQAGKLIRCVVIDIDATFLTLRMEYKKGIGCDIKVNANSKDLIKINGMNVNGFDYKDDFFRA